MRHFFAPILLLLLLVSTAPAKTLTFDQVHTMPRSIEKDYYIWRYLCQGNCTASQANALIKEVNRINKKIRSSYRKKTGRNPGKVTAGSQTSTQAQRSAWLKKVAFQKYFDTAIRALSQKKKDLAIIYFDKARRSAH
jgi:soluble lytic murein transglycosylase